MSERLGQRYLNLREAAEQAQMQSERATRNARDRQGELDAFLDHLGTLVSAADPQTFLATDDNDEAVVIVTWRGLDPHTADAEGKAKNTVPAIDVIKPRDGEEEEND